MGLRDGWEGLRHLEGLQIQMRAPQRQLRGPPRQLEGPQMLMKWLQRHSKHLRWVKVSWYNPTVWADHPVPAPKGVSFIEVVQTILTLPISSNKSLEIGVFLKDAAAYSAPTIHRNCRCHNCTAAVQTTMYICHHIIIPFMASWMKTCHHANIQSLLRTHR